MVDSRAILGGDGGPTSEALRSWFFFLFLVLFCMFPVAMVYALWSVSSVASNLDETSTFVSVFDFFFRGSPLVFPKASILSDFAPVVGAGLLSAAAPLRGSWTVIVSALAVCAAGYLSYLVFSIVIDGGLIPGPGVNAANGIVGFLISGDFISYPIGDAGPKNPEEARSVLLQFSENMRLFYGVVFAALLGVKFRK